MTRRSGLVAWTIGAAAMSASIVAMPQAPAPSPSVPCEQSESVNVRLTVKGREWQADSVEAECFVEGPISSESVSMFGQPNRVRSTRKWTVKREQEQSRTSRKTFTESRFLASTVGLHCR